MHPPEEFPYTLIKHVMIYNPTRFDRPYVGRGVSHTSERQSLNERPFRNLSDAGGDADRSTTHLYDWSALQPI